MALGSIFGRDLAIEAICLQGKRLLHGEGIWKAMDAVQAEGRGIAVQFTRYEAGPIAETPCQCDGCLRWRDLEPGLRAQLTAMTDDEFSAAVTAAFPMPEDDDDAE